MRERVRHLQMRIAGNGLRGKLLQSKFRETETIIAVTRYCIYLNAMSRVLTTTTKRSGFYRRQPFAVRDQGSRRRARLGWQEGVFGMRCAMRPVPGPRLHLLDEGAVLFDEHSQDLYLLNATAAFVWCCLEDCLERDQVLTAIEQEYGVARAAAARQVNLLILQWQELELLADAERDRSPRTPRRPRASSSSTCSAGS